MKIILLICISLTFSISANVNIVKSNNKTTLNVATFNIAGLTTFAKGTKKRIRVICNQLKKSNFEVIFLQEVWFKSGRKLFKDCGYKNILTPYGIGLKSKRKGKRKGLLNLDTGLLILSKYPFVSSAQVTKKKNPFKLNYSKNGSKKYFYDGEAAAHKGAIGAFIKKNNQPIFIATTHMVAEYNKHSYNIQRMRQMTELREWLLKKSLNKPIIFGGDFNSSPPPRTGHRKYNTDKIWPIVITQIFPDEIFLEAKNLDYANLTTYPKDEKNYPLGLGVLDHLFGSFGAKPITSTIIFKEKFKIGKKSKRLSDHYGLNTVFQIN